MSDMTEWISSITKFGHKYAYCEDLNKLSDSSSLDSVPHTIDDVSIDQANLITSKISDKSGLHTVMLDIDFPMIAIQSTQEGHGHLYIDKPMPWKDIRRLLAVMVDVGLVEEGYANACIIRKYTSLRPPWIRKPSHLVRISKVKKQADKEGRKWVILKDANGEPADARILNVDESHPKEIAPKSHEPVPVRPLSFRSTGGGAGGGGYSISSSHTGSANSGASGSSTTSTYTYTYDTEYPDLPSWSIRHP